jgi:hypothetical protein
MLYAVPLFAGLPTEPDGSAQNIKRPALRPVKAKWLTRITSINYVKGESL